MKYRSEEAYDAACDAADDMREKAIAYCMEDKAFQWKWRIVCSMQNKILDERNRQIRKPQDERDWTEYKRMQKKVAKLNDWCEDQIKESLDAIADCAAEAADPYAYRGLRRSDF